MQKLVFVVMRGELMTTYTNNLRSIRMREHMTQEQVAGLLGMSIQAYQPYEYGKRELRISMLRTLAPALNSTAMEILGLENEPWVVKRSPARVPSLAADEKQLIEAYRALTDEGRLRLMEYASDLVASGRYRRQPGDGAALQSA